jgi:hypothetical protein
MTEQSKKIIIFQGVTFDFKIKLYHLLLEIHRLWTSLVQENGDKRSSKTVSIRLAVND